MTFLSKRVRIKALVLFCGACSTANDPTPVGQVRQAVEACGSTPDCSPYACRWPSTSTCYDFCHYDEQCAMDATCRNECLDDNSCSINDRDALVCYPNEYDHGCPNHYAYDAANQHCFTECDRGDGQCMPGYVCWSNACIAAGGSGGASGAGGGGASGGTSGSAGGSIASADHYPAFGCRPMGHGWFESGTTISATGFVGDGAPLQVFCPFVHHAGNTSVLATAKMTGSTACAFYVQAPDGTLPNTSPVSGSVSSGGAYSTMTFASQSVSASENYLFAYCTIPIGDTLVEFSVTEVP